MSHKMHASSHGPGVTESRTAAAMMLADLRSGTLLDAAFDNRAGALDPRDRRWVQELVWGLLRQRNRLDAILAERVRGGIAKIDDDVTDLLRLGTYQLLSMGSVPPYAAIGQTVELTKRRHGIGASKLANAVLRRIDRERDTLEPPVPTDPLEALALRYSHPRWAIARWVDRWGMADTERLLATNNEPASITVRPYGIDRPALDAMLVGAGVITHDVPVCPESIRLGTGVALTELSAFTQGLLFVQDPAATLVAQYAHVPHGSVVADLCAAPGGKALELARRAKLVIAADRSMARVDRMVTGFGRVHATNLVPLVCDARDAAVADADVVLIDVPCTGTGTFRRHPDARWRMRVSDFAVLPALQREILLAAADVVKPGGLLVYSTCSLELEENDDQVESFLATHREFTLEPPPAGTVSPDVLDEGLLRVLPQQFGTDGAFAARLRRAH
ncbi:MAG: 16S rRNA (cytosine(967)-C(5))-methyltransferase RsmB [Gemmatimonadota bacterium]|nr:16S rRNA (cytosine(967)-C(5))-methyltransferase RsmB [Gemmatimonadota bacterium]MDQ8168285.1 16S rRNA (cytosine(967)-C(5))-methyltransferase RsmB [Gemmatimonadota bacterium]MDQ8171268.1 16S rRNA (cytosine(967)-C(5))-methyltransferase RsmB [Gemmatimonadota bacterium]